MPVTWWSREVFQDNLVFLLTACSKPFLGSNTITLPMNEGRPCFSFSGNPVTNLTARALSLAEYAGITRRNLQNDQELDNGVQQKKGKKACLIIYYLTSPQTMMLSAISSEKC